MHNAAAKVSDTGSTLSAVEKVSDPEGRVQGARDSYGNWTFQYSGENFLPATIQLPTPGRPEIRIERNAFELPTKLVDPANPGSRPTEIAYNSANLPVRLIDSLNRQTDISYTPSHQVSQVTQYLNGAPVVVRSYTHQGGYVKSMADAFNHVTTIQRDSLGRVTALIDPTGVTFGFSYDEKGRRWKVHDPRLSGDIVYSYDELDRVISISTPAGITTFTYDPVTKWLSKTTDVMGRSMERTYEATTGDLIGTTLKMAGQPDLRTTMVYSRLGGLQSITPGNGSSIFFDYDSAGTLLGSREAMTAPLGPPKFLRSNRAVHGGGTMRRNHVFTWAAPDSSLPIVGYSFALDGAPDETVDRFAGAASASWNDLPIGTHSFRVKAVDSEGRWGEVAIFNLTILPLTPWEQWRISHFSDAELDDSQVSGEFSCPASDQVSNLVKYAFNLEPKKPSVTSIDGVVSGLPRGAWENGKFTLTYQRDTAKTDLTYQVEWSEDHVVWVTSGITEEVSVQHGTSETVKATVPNGAQRFLRLKIVKS